ncbi:hypothetical protein AeMF1_021561 [Aphanomyces euteiches]|nr:hypothetical protein AeMF1_021561 [Aphanomyces euteiches]
MILSHINERHASKNTVMHALYAHYYLGMKCQDVARVFHKSTTTISNWINRFETSGDYERKQTTQKRGFATEQYAWVVRYFEAAPMSFLDEAKHAFEVQFKTKIALTTVWRIIHQHGMTWKVAERRAINIKESEITRYFNELCSIEWGHCNIQFLDEVSFDSRGMLRKRGYAMKGTKLCFRGEFERKPRVSLLCFVDVTGFVEVFSTEGTFDRAKFVSNCVTHASSVQRYPGSGSVWILDGASIHCHPDIVYLLRSHGIVPIFLPAYCAFFNPIEFAFDVVKMAFRRGYEESKTKALTQYVMSIMQQFRHCDMTKTFEHCGYTVQGRFDPTKRHEVSSEGHCRNEDEMLGFVECQPDS